MMDTLTLLVFGGGVEEWSVFTHFLWMGVMFADFQDDGRGPKEKNRSNRPDEGETRTAKRDFRTIAIMPSRPVTETGSRLTNTFSTLSGEEDAKSSRQWV